MAQTAEPSGEMSQTLQIASVVDHVYVAIRERIRDGALARGARVHQEDLAAELGVSRTPVREALRRLAAEGLVEMHTNRGARVADVSESDMRASYEARLIVEPGAARLAARRGLSEPQARMRAAVATQRRVDRQDPRQLRGQSRLPRRSGGGVGKRVPARLRGEPLGRSHRRGRLRAPGRDAGADAGRRRRARADPGGDRAAATRARPRRLPVVTSPTPSSASTRLTRRR